MKPETFASLVSAILYEKRFFFSVIFFSFFIFICLNNRAGTKCEQKEEDLLIFVFLCDLGLGHIFVNL